jgi:hypothetical protein
LASIPKVSILVSPYLGIDMVSVSAKSIDIPGPYFGLAKIFWPLFCHGEFRLHPPHHSELPVPPLGAIDCSASPDHLF